MKRIFFLFLLVAILLVCFVFFFFFQEKELVRQQLEMERERAPLLFEKTIIEWEEKLLQEDLAKWKKSGGKVLPSYVQLYVEWDQSFQVIHPSSLSLGDNSTHGERDPLIYLESPLWHILERARKAEFQNFNFSKAKEWYFKIIQRSKKNQNPKDPFSQAERDIVSMAYLALGGISWKEHHLEKAWNAYQTLVYHFPDSFHSSGLPTSLYAYIQCLRQFPGKRFWTRKKKMALWFHPFLLLNPWQVSPLLLKPFQRESQKFIHTHHLHSSRLQWSQWIVQALPLVKEKRDRLFFQSSLGFFILEKKKIWIFSWKKFFSQKLLPYWKEKGPILLGFDWKPALSPTKMAWALPFSWSRRPYNRGYLYFPHHPLQWKKFYWKWAIFFSLLALTLVISFFSLLSFQKSWKKRLELQKAREEFFHLVSHELKTPLSTISLYGELVATPHLAQEKLEEYSKLICEECRRLEKWISNILSYARIKGGTSFLQMDSYPL
ncbi:MAG: hypothetical protein D6785_01390, partial [Planctomycetota bacterium]